MSVEQSLTVVDITVLEIPLFLPRSDILKIVWKYNMLQRLRGTTCRILKILNLLIIHDFKKSDEIKQKRPQRIFRQDTGIS